jgi:hypothetical protein
LGLHNESTAIVKIMSDEEKPISTESYIVGDINSDGEPEVRSDQAGDAPLEEASEQEPTAEDPTPVDEEDAAEIEALAGASLPDAHPRALLNLAPMLAQKPDLVHLVESHSANIAPKSPVPVEGAKVHTERRWKNQTRIGMKYKKKIKPTLPVRLQYTC